MLQVSKELISKMKEVSEVLQYSYRHTSKDKVNIRQCLQQEGGIIEKVERFSKEELYSWLAGREIAAVDGSVNQTKGEAPHILYLFQALAKTTTGIECYTTDLYTPLVEEKKEEEGVVNWRAHILAKLELEAATKLLDKGDPAILLMDGALYHYRIDAPDEWEALRAKALERNVLLVGVSEEITTENLVKLDAFHLYQSQPQTFDRDLLFGVLEREEFVYVKEIQQKAGLESVWMRFGLDPGVTGFDMLEEQVNVKRDVARLLLTLAPRNGRGIPLWLDHVDKEVRVTDHLVEALVEQYIDPEIKKRFFERKRFNRPF